MTICEGRQACPGVARRHQQERQEGGQAAPKGFYFRGTILPNMPGRTPALGPRGQGRGPAQTSRQEGLSSKAGQGCQGFWERQSGSRKGASLGPNGAPVGLLGAPVELQEGTASSFVCFGVFFVCFECVLCVLCVLCVSCVFFCFEI